MASLNVVPRGTWCVTWCVMHDGGASRAASVCSSFGRCSFDRSVASFDRSCGWVVVVPFRSLLRLNRTFRCCSLDASSSARGGVAPSEVAIVCIITSRRASFQLVELSCPAHHAAPRAVAPPPAPPAASPPPSLRRSLRARRSSARRRRRRAAAAQRSRHAPRRAAAPSNSHTDVITRPRLSLAL